MVESRATGSKGERRAAGAHAGRERISPKTVALPLRCAKAAQPDGCPRQRFFQGGAHSA